MTALDDVKNAQIELHDSTYWKPSSKGWTTTHLYRCDVLLQSAIVELTPVTPPVLVSSSVLAGRTLTGQVTWTVTTSGDCVEVGFYAETLLGSVLGSSPFVYELDTTRLSNGSHHFGLALYNSQKVLQQPTPQIGNCVVSNNPPVATSPPVVA